MAFETAKIQMSMANPETGVYNTANVYKMAGVYDDQGRLRELSITQLVMAICLSRATDIERRIVDQMDEMSKSTDTLSALAQFEDLLTAGKTTSQTGFPEWTDDTKMKYAYADTSTTPPTARTAEYKNLELAQAVKWYKRNDVSGKMELSGESKKLSDLLDRFLTSDQLAKLDTMTIGEVITKIEEQIDSYNTISQEMLIDVQSQTSKRDDTYSLASNVLKSMYSQMSGLANNLS